MTRRPGGALLLSLAVALAAAGCGKKGNPLPPLRPVPSRIADLAAHRVDDRVELRFTVPPNADGTTPPAVNRVEIYRVATLPGAPAPTSAQVLAGAKDPLTEIRVRQVTEDEDTDAAEEKTAAGPARPTTSDAKPVPPPLPAAGDPATFVDVIDPARTQGVATWSYVAIGVAGRGRRGPVSAAVHVPLGTLPAPPDGLAITSTETSLRISWQPPATGQVVNVFAVDRTATGSPTPTLLTTTPVTAEFAQPVEFGRERCFAVRAVAVTGSTTVEGPLSAAVCVTPVDTYPPAAPSGLQAIQEGTFVTLNWTGVEAADLAGYVVLRGEGEGVALSPLTRTPVRETTFADRTVQPGATYTYSVYAVDNAPTPNVSEQSNRQTVTVR